MKPSDHIEKLGEIASFSALGRAVGDETPRTLGVEVIKSSFSALGRAVGDETQ